MDTEIEKYIDDEITVLRMYLEDIEESIEIIKTLIASILNDKGSENAKENR